LASIVLISDHLPVSARLAKRLRGGHLSKTKFTVVCGLGSVRGPNAEIIPRTWRVELPDEDYAAVLPMLGEALLGLLHSKDF